MGLVINQAFSNGTIRNADNRTASLNTSCKTAKYVADISCQPEDSILILELIHMFQQNLGGHSQIAAGKRAGMIMQYW